MSDLKSDEKDDEAKNEPLIIDQSGEVPQKRILIYYILTVGAILLIVIIVLIVAIQLGGTPSEKNNSFLSKYISDDISKIKLFNSNILNSISSMKIDNKEVSNFLIIYFY